MTVTDSPERHCEVLRSLHRLGAPLMLGWRRLRVRYERSDARFFTFAMLACSAILFNTLQQPPW